MGVALPTRRLAVGGGVEVPAAGGSSVPRLDRVPRPFGSRPARGCGEEHAVVRVVHAGCFGDGAAIPRGEDPGLARSESGDFVRYRGGPGGHRRIPAVVAEQNAVVPAGDISEQGAIEQPTETAGETRRAGESDRTEDRPAPVVDARCVPAWRVRTRRVTGGQAVDEAGGRRRERAIGATIEHHVTVGWGGRKCVASGDGHGKSGAATGVTAEAVFDAAGRRWVVVATTHPGFRSLTQEVSDHRPPVEGTVPDWLSGALIRNGPGRFETDSGRVTHWFDGLAMLRRYAFEDGAVRYTNRFLRTEAYDDAEAGRLTGQFGTDEAGWRRALAWLRALGPPDPTDNANVHVARIDGECVALTEAPRRVAFDPGTLETRGEFAFDDGVPEHVTAAHLVDDAHRDETIGFTTQFGRRPQYHVYRVPSGRRSREMVASIDARGPGYVHDCSATRNHVVLVEPPLAFSLLRALSPMAGSALDILEWEPDEQARLLVVDRDGAGLAAAVELEPVFCFHHVNAYETDDGDAVVLDVVEFPDAGIVDRLRMDDLDGDGFPAMTESSVVRYRVDPEAGTANRTVLYEGGAELPRVAREVVGSRHRHAYAQATGRPDANGLLKLDCETGASEEWWESGTYVEEPVPIRRPDGDGADDGVVVAPALDADREVTDLLVFDAETLDVRARAELPHAEPFGFHGRFFPAE